MTVAGVILDVQQITQQFSIPFNLSLSALAAIVVTFFSLTTIAYLYLGKLKLENARPYIKVNPILSNRDATLEVDNKGASAKLTIRGRIVQGSSRTNIYDICVLDINKNDRKSILIAEIKKSQNIFQQWLDFPKITTTDQNIAALISEQLIDNLLVWNMYPTMRNQQPFYEVIFEITLTTDKPATKVLGTRNYSLKIDREHGLQFTGCE